MRTITITTEVIRQKYPQSKSDEEEQLSG